MKAENLIEKEHQKLKRKYPTKNFKILMTDGFHTKFSSEILNKEKMFPIKKSFLCSIFNEKYWRVSALSTGDGTLNIETKVMNTDWVLVEK